MDAAGARLGGRGALRWQPSRPGGPTRAHGGSEGAPGGAVAVIGQEVVHGPVTERARRGCRRVAWQSAGASAARLWPAE